MLLIFINEYFILDIFALSVLDEPILFRSKETLFPVLGTKFKSQESDHFFLQLKRIGSFIKIKLHVNTKSFFSLRYQKVAKFLSTTL